MRQEKFLADVGISSKDALLHFNLAPLASRRDMAMLGLIHRTVLRKGPGHFRQVFRVTDDGSRRHRYTLLDQGARSNLRSRSALGLIPVYNMLPADAVEHKTVSAFQANLQSMLKDRASSDVQDWEKLFSPRIPAAKHPLM